MLAEWVQLFPPQKSCSPGEVAKTTVSLQPSTGGTLRAAVGVGESSSPINYDCAIFRRGMRPR